LGDGAAPSIATGITTFLENGGTIEKAREMAAYASIRTTELHAGATKP
jgi:hypothetical protein